MKGDPKGREVDCVWQMYRMIGKLSGRIYLLTAPARAEAGRGRAGWA